jgi:hypothetical protein
MALIFTFIGSIVSAVVFGFTSMIKREPSRGLAIFSVVLALTITAFVYLGNRCEPDIARLKQQNTPNQALQHNDPSCHVPCLRTYRASRGRG